MCQYGWRHDVELKGRRGGLRLVLEKVVIAACNGSIEDVKPEALAGLNRVSSLDSKPIDLNVSYADSLETQMVVVVAWREGNRWHPSLMPHRRPIKLRERRNALWSLQAVNV